MQKHLVNFYFYQNYRQRYTVIPITTVTGPFKFIFYILKARMLKGGKYVVNVRTP